MGNNSSICGEMQHEEFNSEDRVAVESQRVAGEKVTRSKCGRVSRMEKEGCEEPEMSHPLPIPHHRKSSGE